jgi:hypothetical protein
LSKTTQSEDRNRFVVLVVKATLWVNCFLLELLEYGWGPSIKVEIVLRRLPCGTAALPEMADVEDVFSRE